MTPCRRPRLWRRPSARPPTAPGTRSRPWPARPRPAGADGVDEAKAPAPPGAAPARRPTIIDVAARAGVSKSLVSLAMRGDPRVAESSRLRIEEAARELGYRTNWAARSLSAVRSGAVGVLVADLRNPWSMDVVEAASQVLEEAGLTTLLTSAVLPSSTDGERRLD